MIWAPSGEKRTRRIFPYRCLLDQRCSTLMNGLPGPVGVTATSKLNLKWTRDNKFGVPGSPESSSLVLYFTALVTTRVEHH